MIFGDVPTTQAQGLILAHSLTLPDGGVFKKGRILTAEDAATLAAAGLATVIGGRLEAGDLGEDEAADRVAATLTGPHVGRTGALTGRSNLFAETDGLLVIDQDRVRRLNRVDEAVTVSTLPAWSVVRPRQIVATVKIIPFAVGGRSVEACAAMVAGEPPAISVRPFVAHWVAMIQTVLKGTRSNVLRKAAEANRGRIEALGGQWSLHLHCEHKPEQVAEAVRKAVAAGCTLVMVSGASATVDRRDVVPDGITRAGGRIAHFGMPVDPGNLLLLAHLGEVTVIDLPGCARSPNYNGLDLVLARLAAGLAVTAEDIMDMGVGGLLKEIPTRPLPRARASPL